VDMVFKLLLFILLKLLMPPKIESLDLDPYHKSVFLVVVNN
jgi:hypothetical protein